MFRSLAFCVLVGLTSLVQRGFADEPALRGTVVDLDQKPISEAEVTLHRWDGVMSPALETTKTDSLGQFEVPAHKDDAHFYFIIKKASYAPISPLAEGDSPLKATLRPAVKSWINVRNDAGEPLKGARLSSLAIRTPENEQTFIWRGMEHLFDFEFAPSDDAGRLILPPLPRGSTVDLRVDHPQWAQARLGSVNVREGRISEIILPKGVMTTFQFVVDSRSPMALDGLICETMLLSQRSSSAESLLRVPMTISGDSIRFCAHPVTYDTVRLKVPGFAITPHFDRLTIERQQEKAVRFLARKIVNVSGRVMRRDGTAHPGVTILGQIENLSPDGPVRGVNPWTYTGSVDTDAEGKFTIALAPGRSHVEVMADGFVADPDVLELEVRPDGPNEIPDFITDRLEPVRGLVVNESNQPVPGAIVRVRHPSMIAEQAVVSDAEGRYEISIPRVSVDPVTLKRNHELNVAAFVTETPLTGLVRVDLRQPETLRSANIVLRPDQAADSLLTMEDNRWLTDRKQKALAEAEAESAPQEKYPSGERGQPAPDLDGAAWFNTEARSLKDLRGRYVLLDFWFTGCGPCHADFPSVKLVHERFEKQGVTVVAVHDNSSTVEAVREHCRKLALSFPIVVDQPDGRILETYRKLGVSSFPSYILIGPDGKILENDCVRSGPPLRLFKLEVIRQHVLEGL